MKRILLTINSLLFTFFLFAQQDKQLTQYMFDRMSFNPAITGFRGYSGTLIYRNQWDRVENAPNTTLFNVQGNMQNWNTGPGRFGMGLSFTNDAIGYQKNNTVVVNLAYHLPTSAGTLSAGFAVGMLGVGYDPDWIPPTPDYDEVIDKISNSIVQFGFDANAGLYWYGNEGYYVGISSTHLTPADLGLINFSVARHYYVLAGTQHEIGKKYLGRDKPIHLRPSVLVKADGSTAIVDLNIMSEVWLDGRSYCWGGLTYRFSDAVGLMAGYARNGFKVGYAFDIMTNPLSEYGRGTHELMVSYALFPPRRPISRHGCPIILQ